MRKGYLREKNILKLVLAIQYFRKLISLFHKNYSNKSTTISETITIRAQIAKPTMKPIVIK